MKLFNTSKPLQTIVVHFNPRPGRYTEEPADAPTKRFVDCVDFTRQTHDYVIDQQVGGRTIIPSHEVCYIQVVDQ